jgi:vacuolar-type H+-ATPase subunit I/STV1
MPSLATETESSESAKTNRLDALKKELHKRQQSAEQSTESDRNKSRHQRWTGLAHEIDADIQQLNQVNSTYSSLYRKAVTREYALLAQIERLQQALEVQSELAATSHTDNIDSQTQPKQIREYQARNPYKLHKPVSDVATSTHEHPIAATPLIRQPKRP